MSELTKKPNGCLSFLIGVLLAVFIPAVLLGLGIYSNALWILLMPGWAIFHPGRDDGFEILMATMLDAMIWWVIAYGVMYGIMNWTSKAELE